MAERWALDAALVPQATGDVEGRTSLRRGAIPRPVTRVVEANARALELVGLLGQVPAGDAKLTMRGAVSRRHEQSDLRTYKATLRFGGVVPVRQDVEIDVTAYGASVGSLALRSAERLPRRLGEDVYREAALSALASIERLLPFQAASSAAQVRGGVIEAATAVLEGADMDMAEELDSPEDEQAA